MNAQIPTQLQPEHHTGTVPYLKNKGGYIVLCVNGHISLNILHINEKDTIIKIICIKKIHDYILLHQRLCLRLTINFSF